MNVRRIVCWIGASTQKQSMKLDHSDEYDQVAMENNICIALDHTNILSGSLNRIPIESLVGSKVK